jgi:competence protein ComEC
MKRFGMYFAVFAVLAAIFAWADVLASDSDFRVVFFDVGQGDAIMIQKGNVEILIDGGPDSGILSKLGENLSFFDRKIELVVMSHSDADHISGFIDVLRKYEVDAVLATFAEDSSADYQAILELISEKNIKTIQAQVGLRVFLDDENFLDVLYPFDDLRNHGEVKDNNAISVVLRLTVRDESFLFTGDLPKAQEYEIISQGINVEARVLKVGHHGSKTSTSEQFLEAVGPDVAVISAGRKNRYGHPHQEVIERLVERGIDISRTDLSGDIIFELR